MNLNLLKKEDFKPKNYDRENLAYMVWELQMNARDIEEAYGKDETGEYKVSSEQIERDLKRWVISPTIIQTFDIVNMMHIDIAEIDKTIKKYTSNNKARMRNIKDVVKILDQIKVGLQTHKDTSEIKQQILGLFAFDIKMSDIIKFQQKDEEIRATYIKIKLEEKKHLNTVVKTATSAIEIDAYMVSIFEELSLLDAANGTSLASNFLENTQKRIQKKLGDNPILQNKKLSMLQKQAEKRTPKTISLHNNMSAYHSKVRDLANEHGVHFNVMKSAVKVWKDSHDENDQPTKQLTQCIADVIPAVREKFPYIMENGKANPELEEKNRKKKNEPRKIKEPD